jgi:uncharacterized protein with PQ loop repeat
MQFIELIYLLASFAAVIGMAPQIIQLLRTKKSDELSLTTWIVWMTYQSIALVYAISMHMVVYTVVNILWVMFYAAMIALIVKYHKNAKQTPVQAAIVEPTKGSELTR